MHFADSRAALDHREVQPLGGAGRADAPKPGRQPYEVGRSALWSGVVVRDEPEARAGHGRLDTMSEMTATERRLDHATNQAHRMLRRLGGEIREARLEHDLSQMAAARAARLSKSSWSRLERGIALNVPFTDLARACTAVGLVLKAQSCPGGEPVRDAPQLGLLERFRSVLPSTASWATEVPFPNPGDPRAWDAMVRVTEVRIGLEAETRGFDSQALQRKLALKRRDGNVDHIILLMADTRHNRSFLRAAGEGLQRDFPVPGKIALDRLKAGHDPGGSSIILI